MFKLSFLFILRGGGVFRLIGFNECMCVKIAHFRIFFLGSWVYFRVAAFD